MNTMPSIAVILGSSLIAFSASADEQTTSIKVNNIKTDQDTAILIKKGGTDALKPVYEIVEGDGDISGDPASGAVESLASWKTACAEWKKEIRELNKDNQVLILNCNKAHVESLPNGQRVYSSTGTYKLKVKTGETTK